MGRKQKPRVIPAQDNRICGSIWLCQLTVVLSCVYLSVAIYIPSSLRAFISGFEPDPVMCQTINFTMATYCPWTSCGEWCLTKTSGFCPQIHATVRRNGTDIQLNNCSRILTNSCPEVSFETLPKINCNEGENCAILNGVFNCTKGHCRNMTDRYLCHHTADGITLDPDKENTKLNGFFECAGSRCTKIKRAFSCDRICPKITTISANVFLMQDNSLIAADCESGLAFNEARGAEPGIRISPPQLFWGDLDGFLLTNCMTVEIDGNKIKATDCLKGTLVNSTIIPEISMNFTQLWRIYEESDHFVDPSQKFLPHQSYVTIYNTSRIYINSEGCVNTLKGECKEFTTKYGNDGANDTAQSRYQCYYNKNDPAFVIA